MVTASAEVADIKAAAPITALKSEVSLKISSHAVASFKYRIPAAF